MLYTVKEVSELSQVTVKTLHHYHKIQLLLPREVSEAGYRLYGTEELERLQEILFFKELDFPLDRIKDMLERKADRLSLLTQQEELLRGRHKRLEAIMETLRQTITSIKEGTNMTNQDLFKGFADKEAWNEALREQNQHLEAAYGMEPIAVDAAQVEEMNRQAAEAKAFMNEMAGFLRSGVKHHDEKIRKLISDHLAFMNAHGHPISVQGFADQTRFFLNDDFHLQLLEQQQTGLAYYLAAAAQALVEASA